MIRNALIEGPYRYNLFREWGTGTRLCWVMLNPSTADAETDDPTIRRVLRFSREWGYEAVEVVNLFALRSTDPRVLRHDVDCIGPRNDDAIVGAAMAAELVVCAWGLRGAIGNRGNRVRNLLEDAIGRVWNLGLNANGTPKHPLYVPAEKRPEVWA